MLRIIISLGSQKKMLDISLFGKKLSAIEHILEIV